MVDSAPAPTGSSLSTVASTAAEAASSQQPVTVTATNRLEQTTACLPIVYGSVAFYLGKKADELQTHQWTLYLRGPNCEDLSLVIEKVVFQLHASFAIPTRELTAPPFEVTERGWGEFEAQIRIIWKDPTEKATVVVHGIKLYAPGTPTNALPTETNVPVVAESYDEVVFTEPTELFFRQLQRLSSVPTITYSQQAHFGKFSDTEDVQALLEAQKFLQNELVRVKERLRLADEDLAQVDGALRQAQESRKNSSAPGSRKSSAVRTSGATAAATNVAPKKQKTATS